MKLKFKLVVLLLLILQITRAQDTVENSSIINGKIVNGFVRAGAYEDLKKQVDKRYLSTAFSDIDLKADIDNNINFKTYAELLFRYGAEFNKPVRSFDLREGYVKLYGKKWDISAGQKIIRWGRADFTNLTSNLAPMNLLLRSPDRDELYLGNLLSEINFYPSHSVRIQVVAIPFYRTSILNIEPVPLPPNVTINLIDDLIAGGRYASFGIKTDFHLQGADIGVSWFSGYDPMPGIALTNFLIDTGGVFQVAKTELSAKPYKTNVAGIDFEFTQDAFGFRGEFAWSKPVKNYNDYEYVPLPSIDLVAGSDWSSGNWRISGEYAFRWMYSFTRPSTQPIIGSEPDYAAIAALMQTPEFDLNEYIRQQVSAFNRLYNYQLKEYYHSLNGRIESDLLYGRLSPSVTIMYNLTSEDLLVIPEIKYKPGDNITVTVGAEYYNGPRGSLYHIIEGFMSAFYLTMRVNF
jgi:hypothetical protein